MGAALGGLTVVGFAALCIPVDLMLDYDTMPPRLHLRLVWLFGLVKREVARPVPRLSWRSLFRPWRQRRLSSEVKRFSRDVLTRARIREMSVNVRLGLGDPFATGMACAAAATATPLASLLPAGCQFRFEPSFTERVFRARLHSDLRLQPLRLVVPLLRFALSPAGRRMARSYLGHRRTRLLRPAFATGR